MNVSYNSVNSVVRPSLNNEITQLNPNVLTQIIIMLDNHRKEQENVNRSHLCDRFVDKLNKGEYPNMIPYIENICYREIYMAENNFPLYDLIEDENTPPTQVNTKVKSQVNTQIHQRTPLIQSMPVWSQSQDNDNQNTFASKLRVGLPQRVHEYEPEFVFNRDEYNDRMNVDEDEMLPHGPYLNALLYNGFVRSKDVFIKGKGEHMNVPAIEEYIKLVHTTKKCISFWPKACTSETIDSNKLMILGIFRSIRVRDRNNDYGSATCLYVIGSGYPEPVEHQSRDDKELISKYVNLRYSATDREEDDIELSFNIIKLRNFRPYSNVYTVDRFNMFRLTPVVEVTENNKYNVSDKFHRASSHLIGILDSSFLDRVPHITTTPNGFARGLLGPNWANYAKNSVLL